MESKDKVIKLFKTFLENKKHQFHYRYSDSKALGRNQAMIVDIDEVSGHDRHYVNEYKIDGNKRIFGKSDIEYYRKHTNHKFLDANKCIKHRLIGVVIDFGEEPNLILVERTKPKMVTSSISDTIKCKGFRRLSHIPFEVVHYRYKSVTTRTLVFGSLKFKISLAEFNELLEYAKGLQLQRDNDIDEAELDIRLEKYTK